MNETPLPQDHPIRILPDNSHHPAFVQSLPELWHRRVKVAGRVFTVTPETCYKHFLSDGTDYYPYYDFSLVTADNDDHDIDFEQWINSQFNEF